MALSMRYSKLVAYQGIQASGLNWYPVSRCTAVNCMLESSSSESGSDRAAVNLSPGTTGPTPDGVPVSSKSPSSRAMMEDTCSMSFGIRNIMSAVVPFCLNVPFILSQIFRLCGSGTDEAGMNDLRHRLTEILSRTASDEDNC